MQTVHPLLVNREPHSSQGLRWQKLVEPTLACIQPAYDGELFIGDCRLAPSEWYRTEELVTREEKNRFTVRGFVFERTGVDGDRPIGWVQVRHDVSAKLCHGSLCEALLAPPRRLTSRLFRLQTSELAAVYGVAGLDVASYVKPLPNAGAFLEAAVYMALMAAVRFGGRPLGPIELAVAQRRFLARRGRHLEDDEIRCGQLRPRDLVTLLSDASLTGCSAIHHVARLDAGDPAADRAWIVELTWYVSAGLPVLCLVDPARLHHTEGDGAESAHAIVIVGHGRDDLRRQTLVYMDPGELSGPYMQCTIHDLMDAAKGFAMHNGGTMQAVVLAPLGAVGPLICDDVGRLLGTDPRPLGMQVELLARKEIAPRLAHMAFEMNLQAKDQWPRNQRGAVSACAEAVRARQQPEPAYAWLLTRMMPRELRRDLAGNQALGLVLDATDPVQSRPLWRLAWNAVGESGGGLALDPLRPTGAAGSISPGEPPQPWQGSPDHTRRKKTTPAVITSCFALGLDECFGTLRELGVQAVDIYLPSETDGPLYGQAWDATHRSMRHDFVPPLAKQIGELLRHHRLKVVAITTSFNDVAEPVIRDEQQNAVSSLVAALRLADELKVATVEARAGLCVYHDTQDRLVYDDDEGGIKRLLASLTQVAKKRAELGISAVLALEPEPGELFVLRSIAQLRSLARAVNESDVLAGVVGLNLDIGHLRIWNNGGTIRPDDLLDDNQQPLLPIYGCHVSDHILRHWADLPLGTFHRTESLKEWLDFYQTFCRASRPHVSVELERGGPIHTVGRSYRALRHALDR